MMKNAFSLIELIFVIVLMGVLAGIGFYMSRPDPTRTDAQYTLLQLKEARYRAIGYETEDENICSEGGWVQLAEASLENDGSISKHDIKSAISPDGLTICFDSLGRPHDENKTSLDSLLRVPLDINFTTKGGGKSTIRLYPQSGYAIIPCKIN